jgi:Zn-dependent peptidase ImmA (M78 family)/transcriptional regulator with XRE-family HTH domain
MGDKAFITPAVMKWARESAKISPERAAAKVAVTARKIHEWEQGIDQPTIRQAKLLAEMYKRPFALFMLPKPPRDFTPLRDFRRKNAAPLTTASVFIIRELQEKQAWTHEWNEEEGLEPLPFVGRFSLKDSPEKVASDLLKVLGIDPPHYTRPMKEWIEKAESNGIFISRASFIHSRLTLNSDEFQGFTIADPLAPFIFLNSEDWDSSQLFTLVHELAHIWIAQSGISNEIGPEATGDAQIDPIERFCNEVAGIALMPKFFMEGLPSSTFSSADEVYRQAHRCGVSSFALLVRAHRMGLITEAGYARLKKDSDKAFLDFAALQEMKKALPKGPGGPNPHRLRAYRNGILFSRLVLDAFRGGFIPPTQASSLLGTAINQFPKLESFVYA